MDKYFTQSITIQRPTYSSNEMGERVPTYGSHLTVQGRMRPKSGKEVYMSDRPTAIGTHRLYCLPADIKETDRVVHDGKNYKILFVKDVMEFGHHLEIDLEVIT